LARRAGPTDSFLHLTSPLDIRGVEQVQVGREIVSILPASVPATNLVMTQNLAEVHPAGTRVACLPKRPGAAQSSDGVGSLDRGRVGRLLAELREMVLAEPGRGDGSLARVEAIRAELLAIDDSTVRDSATRLIGKLETWVDPGRWRRWSQDPVTFAGQLQGDLQRLEQAVSRHLEHR